VPWRLTECSSPFQSEVYVYTRTAVAPASTDIDFVANSNHAQPQKGEVLTFATAMADCGMLFTDEHEYDLDEVDESDLNCYQ
jgi:hypothetical protein